MEDKERNRERCRKIKKRRKERERKIGEGKKRKVGDLNCISSKI